MTVQHVVTIKLDIAAQHRLDRLIDLLEAAITRGPLTPEETADIVRQLRAETDKLRAASQT